MDRWSLRSMVVRVPEPRVVAAKRSTTRAIVPRRTCKNRTSRRVSDLFRASRHGRDLERGPGKARVLRTGGRPRIAARENRTADERWTPRLTRTRTRSSSAQAKDQAILDYQKNKKDTQVRTEA
eukprot:scaffold524_cov357-Pavlova_lutheri.AAC.45